MKLYALCTLHEVIFFHLISRMFIYTHISILLRLVGVHVLVSVMQQPLPQPLINKPKRKTTTSTILINDRLFPLLLVTTPPAPTKFKKIFHHHHTMMNQCKLPSIIIGNTRSTGQEIEVLVVGGDPRTNWSCELQIRDDRITHERINGISAKN